MQLQGPNLLSKLVQNAVSVNGVLIPLRMLQTALASYARNLVVFNDDPTYKVSLLGSASCVKYRGRYLMLCTRHQIAEINDLERVGILSANGSHFISSGGVRHFQKGLNEGDYHDVCAFDFTDACKDLPEYQHGFFDFNEVPPDTDSDLVAFVQLTGFPSDDQAYELHEANHLGLAKRFVFCELDAQSEDPAVFRLRNIQKLDFDPDGMSGGMAFVVQVSSTGATAYFAGIVTRGGKEHFHIVKAGFIKRFLDQFVLIG